jgi:FKBP-type peptidyl-prolyl cis-trans isomerase FkpA
MRRATLCLLVAALTGCSLDVVRSKPLGAQSNAASAVVGSPETLTYAPSLHVDLDMMVRTESGLYWKDLTEGTGAEAVRGSVAVVEYSGWLANGNLFDSSKNAGRPFSFPVGQGRVITGWDQGVAGMRVGGKRLLVIPPQLGYGASGAGARIPGNATLVFEVELLEVQAGR